MSDRDRTEKRLVQGAIFVAGAGAYFALFVGADVGFGWTPFALGIVYLAVALAGGRRGGHWATALVLLAWGIAAALVLELEVDAPSSGAYLTAVGAGGLVAAGLRSRGVAVELPGVAGAILGAGAFLLLARYWGSEFGAPETYAYLVGAVGLFNLVQGVRGRRAEAAPA